jgi:hypothetical protein
VYSLSKQSNLAGYRAGFVAGCGELVGELLTARKHLGLMPPAPVQAAMIAALGDERHVVAQKALYRRRRDALVGALTASGFRIDGSEAGLYPGRRATRTAGRRLPRSRVSASSWPPAPSTARPVRGTCAWRSRRPTSE